MVWLGAARAGSGEDICRSCCPTRVRRALSRQAARARQYSRVETYEGVRLSTVHHLHHGNCGDGNEDYNAGIQEDGSINIAWYHGFQELLEQIFDVCYISTTSRISQSLDKIQGPTLEPQGKIVERERKKG